MNPIDADKNAFDATKALLDFSRVRATKRGLREALNQHPDFPSLNSLSDVLNDFKVPNLSTRVTPDQLGEIPLPALTYLNVDGGLFAPLRSVNGSVEWLHTQRGWQKESVKHFLRKWDGITLLIEPTEQSGERDYTQNRRLEKLAVLRWAFIVVAILTILGLSVLNALQTFPWDGYSAYYLAGMVKLIGAVVSGTLVWYSLDTQNEFLQKVCRLNGQANCQDILSSSAAKLKDWLSWAEVGLFYFAGGLIAVTIGLWMGNSDLLTSLGGSLYLLTLLALPYTIWSIQFQWRVAREWCVLCLTVQVLLWVEFYFAFQHFGLPINAEAWVVNSTAWRLLVASYLITPILWTATKRSLQKAAQYGPLFKNYQKIKFNEGYIQSSFSDQNTMPPIFEGMKTVKIGNMSAQNKLVIVSNTMCRPCAKNHKDLSKLFDIYDDVLCEYIFIGTQESLTIAAKIISAPANNQAYLLDDWYKNINQNSGTWMTKLNLSSELTEEELQQLRLYSSWCRLAGINTTPKLYLNGIELPPIFNMNDVPNLCKNISIPLPIPS